MTKDELVLKVRKKRIFVGIISFFLLLLGFISLMLFMFAFDKAIGFTASAQCFLSGSIGVLLIGYVLCVLWKKTSLAVKVIEDQVTIYSFSGSKTIKKEDVRVDDKPWWMYAVDCVQLTTFDNKEFLVFGVVGGHYFENEQIKTLLDAGVKSHSNVPLTLEDKKKRYKKIRDRVLEIKSEKLKEVENEMREGPTIKGDDA